jgi:hypothetical protein
MDRIVKEAIHIRLNEENFNRDNGFNMSRAWFPITRMLASQKAEPGKGSNDLTGKPPVANGRSLEGLGCPPNPDYFYDLEDEDRDGLRNVGLY